LEAKKNNTTRLFELLLLYKIRVQLPGFLSILMCKIFGCIALFFLQSKKDIRDITMFFHLRNLRLVFELYTFITKVAGSWESDVNILSIFAHNSRKLFSIGSAIGFHLGK
jgi:hypothetical protein